MKCLLAVITLFSWIGVAVSVPCPIPDFYNEDFEPFRSQSKTEFRTKRRLFLRCKEAYVKDSGTNWIVCQSNGEWRNYGQLQCKLRSCRLPHHTSLPHGDYEIDDNGDFTVGQRMRITCDDGYEMDTLNGSPWRRCMANGEINYEWPRCEPKRCSKPAIDDKMEVSLSIVDNWDFHHGDSVYVKCPGGYDVTGTRKSNDHIFCKSGSWSKEFKCEEKTCQDPDIIDGFVEKSASNDEKCEEKWFSGCQADVKCVEGAAVRNYEDRTIMCSSDGFWDNVPQCYKYCTSDSITNGYLESYRRERVIKNGATGTYHCDWGYERDTYYDEVKCMFSVAHARSRSRWSWEYEYNDAPYCKEKQTELRRADGTLYYNSADDSRISGYSTDLEHDTGVRMECDSGYQIPEGYVSGQSVYFRAYFGEWKYEFNERSRNDTNQPKCEEAPCDVPTNDHTYYKDADWSNEDITGEVKSGLEIYAYCDDDDYELVEVNNGRIDRPDRNRMDCTKGTWNRQVRCREKSCYFANPDRKTLRLSDNVEEEGYKLHDRDMTIKCAEGYEFKPGVDEQFVKCQYGTWIDDNNGDVTTECSAKPCEVPSNDFTSYKKYQDGESITGYRQSGRSIYVRCESADYERVEVNVNGDMERTTQDRMRCSTGNWNLQLKCRERSCHFANPRGNTLRSRGGVEAEGFKLHDRVMNIKCAEGYEFKRGVDEQYVKCQYGKWKDDNGGDVTTECSAKPCEVPSNDFTSYKNYQGGVSITGYSESGRPIYISCASDAYEVVEVRGNDNMVITTRERMYCTTGNWNLKLKCREKSCDFVNPGRNTLLSDGNVQEETIKRHDHEINIKCAEGYEFKRGVGEQHVTCQYGKWRDDDDREVTTKCFAKPCEVPSNDFTSYKTNQYGEIITGSRDSGDSIYVSCESDNYERAEVHDNGDMDRTDHNTMRCSRGEWIRQLKCREKSCPIDASKHILRGNGQQIKRDSFTHGEDLTIQCEQGHQFINLEDVTSMDIKCDRGKWRNHANNEVTPSCGEISCQVPTDEYTVYTVARNEETVTPGSSVTVTCSSRNYEMTTGKPVEYMSCGSNGEWNQMLSCKPKKCLATPTIGGVLTHLDVPTNITAETFVKHDDKVQLGCYDGFRKEKPDKKNWLVAVCKFGNWVYFGNPDEKVKQLQCFSNECILKKIKGVRYFLNATIKLNAGTSVGPESQLYYNCHGKRLVNITCRLGSFDPPVKCRDPSWCVLPNNDTYIWLAYTTNTTTLNDTVDTQDSAPVDTDLSVTVPIIDSDGDIPDGAVVTYTCANTSTHNASITCYNGTLDELSDCPAGCAASPCQNGGTCEDKEDGRYICQCDPRRYYGINCEEAIGVDGSTLCSRIIMQDEIKLFRAGYPNDNFVNGSELRKGIWYRRMCNYGNEYDTRYVAFNIMCYERRRPSLSMNRTTKC